MMDELMDGSETEELDQSEFKYDELDDRAKARARDKYRETRSETLHDEWWDSVYEDAIECGRRLGIEIGEVTQSYRSRGVEKQYKKPDIWFRGFCSQGDGACFGGELIVKGMANAVAQIKEHAPQDEELVKLAADCERFYAEVSALWMRYRLGPEEEVPDDLPGSVDGVYFTIKGEERCYTTKVESLDSCVELEEFANQIVSTFADWIYDQLEKESDYLNSDDYIEQRLLDEEYVFDEDGDFS